jgi:hypothetical protein
MSAVYQARSDRERGPTGGPIRLDEEDLKHGLQLARQTLGHVLERPWADGVTVSYGAQVRAYGRYEKVTFGTTSRAGTAPAPSSRSSGSSSRSSAGTGSPHDWSRARIALNRRWLSLASNMTRRSAYLPRAGGAPSSWGSSQPPSTTMNGGSATCSGSSAATA